MSTVARVDRLPGGDDGAVALVVIVVAEARRAEPPPLLYAALRGSRALGPASSSLRPTSRSDRPTSTAAPSRTNPATTGTEMATPASRETRRTPSRPTSLTVIAASVHYLGARATYHEDQSPGNEGPLRAGVVAPAASDSPIMRRLRALAGGLQPRPPGSDGIRSRTKRRRTTGGKRTATEADQVRM